MSKQQFLHQKINNFSNIGGYNSNQLSSAQINFVNVSHTNRHGAIKFLTHNGTNILTALTLDNSQNATFAGELQVNNGKITVQGAEGNSGILEIFSDEGDDNEDKWRLLKSSGNHDLVIQNYGSGSWATNVTFDQNEGATFGGTVSDSKGDLRNIPRNNQTSQYTLVVGDAGKVVGVTSGGWIIPANVFTTVGQVVTLLNRSTSNQTITATALTYLYNTADGVNIKASTLTLGPQAMATIWFEGGDTGYIQSSNLTVS